MKGLDKDLPQDVEGIRGDDRCAEISRGHDKDCSRRKHDNHGDEGYHSENQY